MFSKIPINILTKIHVVCIIYTRFSLSHLFCTHLHQALLYASLVMFPLLHPALFPALPGQGRAVPAGLHGLGAGDRAGPRHARLARGRAAAAVRRAAGECGGGAPSRTVVQLDTSATCLFKALCSLYFMFHIHTKLE